MQYRYLMRGAGGAEIRLRGRVGTKEEAAVLAKTAQWVLSYPVDVWCQQGTDYPDGSGELTGTIEDPALEPLNAQIEGADAPQASDLKIDFASASAAELADKLNLTTADFDGLIPSGKTGFTVADVRVAARLHEAVEV